MKLVNLTGFSLNSTWSLIYQASVDSFRSRSFHAKCDQKSNTLTVIKSNQYNFIFGGFTSAQWNQNISSFANDSNAFVFSLVNSYNIPVKMLVTNSQYAIYPYYDFGPTFGSGYDINLRDNSNITVGYSYIYSYQLPSFVKDRSSFLAGSYEFTAYEIEVNAYFQDRK